MVGMDGYFLFHLKQLHKAGSHSTVSHASIPVLGPTNCLRMNLLLHCKYTYF